MSYTYEQADKMLTGRCKDSKKLRNNTYLQRRGQDIAVRLHSTDVVTFHPNGDVTLNTGGWNTIITWDRINDYAPYRMHNERGVPFLSVCGLTVPFVDGMTVTKNQRIENAGKRTVESIRAEWRETDRENARVSRWKSKARGITRDMSACTKREHWGKMTNRCHCWHCGQKPFRPSKLAEMTAESCAHCGCRKVYTPAKTKLTVAQIEAEQNRKARTAMIICYGLARFLQDAGTVLDGQTPEDGLHSFTRYAINSYHAIAGMRDADNNLIVVSGECRNLAEARKWYGQAAGDSLARKTRGTTEDVIREQLLGSL
jgi:hypothetical protein